MADASSNNPIGVKPLITPDMVLQLLKEHFDQPILDLAVVQGGYVAQTFGFTVGSEESGDARSYIIRFNATMLVNFEKEAYVYRRFASPTLPIPHVVHIGQFHGIHYAIAEKMPGQTLLQIPRADYLALIPALVDMLDTIHRLPVGDSPGYGIFDGNGVAYLPSWKEHLAAVSEEEPEGDFYGKWHSLFRDSFLDRDLFDRIYIKMMQLVTHTPEERWLVHGGYGFGNVLAQDGKISAVLDWMNAMYGDFVSDVAWLDFWSPDDGWRERFEQHYSRTGREVPSFSERLLCYECYISLDAMRFNAKGRDKRGYDWACERILSLVNRP